MFGKFCHSGTEISGSNSIKFGTLHTHTCIFHLTGSICTAVSFSSVVVLQCCAYRFGLKDFWMTYFTKDFVVHHFLPLYTYFKVMDISNG